MYGSVQEYFIFCCAYLVCALTFVLKVLLSLSSLWLGLQSAKQNEVVLHGDGVIKLQVQVSVMGPTQVAS